MSYFARFLATLDELCGGVLKALLKGLFGIDLDARREEALEARAQEEKAIADEAKREQDRLDTLGLQQEQLAALVDLRADLEAWSPPEPGRLDPAVAAERRARHARIKAATEVEVRTCRISDPEVDEELRWRVA